MSAHPARRVLVTIEPGEYLHKLWRNFLSQAPPGFTYIDLSGRPIVFSSHRQKRSILTALYNVKRRIPTVHMRHTKSRDIARSARIDALRPDIVYCVNGQLYYGERPWVVDAENPTVFFGYNYRALIRYRDDVRAKLLDKSCKAILPYSETGKKGLLSVFGDAIKQKIVVARNAVEIPKNRTPIPHEEFTILFTGSANIEDNFYARGGREALHAFVRLAKICPRAKLLLRCRVPKEERHLLRGHNVEIHDEVLNEEQFSALFRRSDVYLLPAYVGYALSVLEAMSYGLPVVTSDLLENAEPISDGISGMLVPVEHVTFTFPGVPEYYFTGKYKHKLSEVYVTGIVERLKILHDDPRLRARMGGNARDAVEESYTRDAKNAVLSSVFKASLH